MDVSTLLPVIRRQLADACLRQPLDPADPVCGGYRSPATGVEEPGHTGLGPLVAALVIERLHGVSDACCRRLEAAGAHWRRMQRPSGRIDLRDCNYDSGPDTAFLVQLLCRTLSLADHARLSDPALDSALRVIEVPLAAMCRGLIDGGFHTPNHRWVSAAGLTLGAARFPDLAAELRPTSEALLAEGPDRDDEGFFIERSIAIYDTVCVRALLDVDTHRQWSEGREAALACLRADRWLMHADGTCESGLSHRQDQGTREVPLNLVPVYLQAARVTGDPGWSTTATWLWEQAAAKAQEAPFSAAVWTVIELLSGAPTAAAAAPADGTVFWPRNRCQRTRAGRTSWSVFGETTRLLAVRHGAVELAALKAGQSYLGHGRFVPAVFERLGAGGVRLRSHGQLSPYRLGYSHPLGEPVPKDEWGSAWDRRGLRSLPACVCRLDVVPQAFGLDVHVVSESGLERVLGQITLDLLPGGVWETDDVALMPQPGQVLFLRRGRARYRVGDDWLEFSGGSDAHRTWSMRDYESPGALVRVAIPLLTPFDHQLQIRWGSGM